MRYEIPHIAEGTYDGVTVVGQTKSNINSKILVRGTNNTIELVGLPYVDNLKVEFLGNNNRLVIGQNCRLRGVITVGDGSRVEFGAGVHITRPSQVVAREGTEIVVGNGCLFSDVTIMSTDAHSILDLTTRKRLNKAKNVRIGDKVWLAEKVAVYKGAEIGRGSVIGARSVVRGTIPENVVAVGVPAKVVRSNIAWSHKLLDDDGNVVGAV